MKHTGIMIAMLFYALSKLSAPPEITDEDITTLFDRFHLYEQYTVYASESMEVNSKIQDDSGLFYCKVTDENYDTWDEWTSFYESIFTEEYTAELMKTEDLYKNVDGFTYVRSGGMDWHLGQMISYEITEDCGNEIVLNITRKERDLILEKYRVFSYLLRYTDDGWRIAETLPEEIVVTPEISENEIIALFERFHLYERYTVHESESMEIDESTRNDGGFCKITDEKYDTWDEWTAFYESIFTEEYAAELIKAEDGYKSIDGFTYCRPGVMGWNLLPMKSYKIEEVYGNEAAVSVCRTELHPGEDSSDEYFLFILRYTDNGWRIASPLPSYHD